MSRGVSFERVLEFFDNAPLRVAQAAVSQGITIVEQRKREEHSVVKGMFMSKPRRSHKKTNAVEEHPQTLGDA